MGKTLDFVIIGAQKSGTTTLFKLLSEHPEIYMPPGKEVPFFTNDEAYASGLDPYLQELFGGAPSHALWGKATPHYLSDQRASERLWATIPRAKLIAILRDPVDRALSHYRMSVRRGIEERTFDQAISDMLDPKALQAARNLPVGRSSEASTYVVWGEYGRLLDAYFSRFPREQILILFTDELASSPKDTCNRMLIFLGVSPFVPKSLGKRFHEGGTKERFPLVVRLAHEKWIRRLWHAVPLRFRSPMTFWFHQVNIVQEIDTLENYSDQTVKKLQIHYQPDIARLEELIGRKAPWPHFISDKCLRI